jgi:[ribosomal protein S5]-alanine N-acetyltransferase
VTAVNELETARLVLRPWTAAEWDAVAEGGRLGGWAADFPDASGVEHADWAATTPLDGPFGFRLVVERESGLVVGSVGLEDGGTQAELFVGIVPSRRGRGYAAESARALVVHAFAVSAAEAVFAFVETENLASMRALERAGFVDNGFPAVDGSTVVEVRRG